MIVHNYDIDNSINSSLSEFETSYHIPFIIDNFLQWSCLPRVFSSALTSPKSVLVFQRLSCS